MLKFIKFLSIAFTITSLLVACNKLDYSSDMAYIKTQENIDFFIVPDIHHFSKSIYDDKEAFQNFLATSDGKLIKYSTEIITSIKEDIRKEQPDFLILPGDLTTSGDKESHIELAELLNEIEQIGTQVLVVPGNHDIENPWSRKFIGSDVIKTDNISSNDWKDIYYQYGYSQAISTDKSSASYLVAASEDLWILMLDSTISNEKSKNLYPIKGGEISKNTLTWINNCSELAKKNNAKLMAVMHHNLLEHSQIFNDSYTVNNKDEVLDSFINANIDLVLTGHIHIQDIKSFTKNETTIYDIGTSSALVYPNQYGTLRFNPANGYTYNTKGINLDILATEFDKEAFKNYVICVFMEQCCNQYKDCLAELDELNDEDLEKAYSIIVEMNKMYFSGFRNNALINITASEGFSILKNVSNCFAQEYVLSMLNDEFENNNTLFIPFSK